MTRIEAFDLRINTIVTEAAKANPTIIFKAPRIVRHYRDRVSKGMTVDFALDRMTHDLYGNNGHKTREQRWPKIETKPTQA